MAYSIIIAAMFALERADLPDPAAVGETIKNALLGAGRQNWAVVSFDSAYPPRPTPDPAPPQVTRWRVKPNAAFLRNGPGTSYQTIGTVNQGEILIEYGREAGWVRTERGWIFGGLLEPVK